MDPESDLVGLFLVHGEAPQIATQFFVVIIFFCEKKFFMLQKSEKSAGFNT